MSVCHCELSSTRVWICSHKSSIEIVISVSKAKFGFPEEQKAATWAEQFCRGREAGYPTPQHRSAQAAFLHAAPTVDAWCQSASWDTEEGSLGWEASVRAEA